MKYAITEHPLEGMTSLVFENGLVVELNRKTGKWALTGWRKPDLSDIQAVIGIILEILTLPVGSKDGGE